MRARLTVALSVAALMAAASDKAPRAAARAPELPNLVALAPFEVEIGEADRESPADPAAPAIRFATGAANRSEHALELVGEPSSLSEATAQQCVSWIAPRICGERSDVGSFVWHSEHGHYHFEDFALYELRRLRRDGSVDTRDKGLVATSGKMSYCIIDYERDEDRGALYAAPYPLYYSCLAGLTMQGISPGWKDVYSSGTQGQQIPLDGIADGVYALVAAIDPVDRLFESDESDNAALVHLELSDGGTKIEVLCAQQPGDTGCLPLED